MSTRPIRSVKVRVSSLVEGWDMRAIHELRDSSKARNLKQGSCLIAFNKAQTIARIVDWCGGVHTYYADEGEIFDLNSLRTLVKQAFYVDLEPGATATRRAAEALEVAA